MSIIAPSGSLQYADLNIRHTGDPKKTLALVKRAVRMGYDAIAINIDVGDLSTAEPEELDMPPPSKKKKKHRGDFKAAVERSIPEPFMINKSLIDTALLEQQGKTLRLFSRLTVTLSDQSMIHNIFMSPQLKQYDIVAVRPKDEAILATLSRKTDAIDLICFSTTDSKIPWTQKGKIMEQIRQEGIGFEITYGPALQTRDERRLVLANGRRIIRCLKKKGIVFCSAAETVLDLRAPVDVMNMLTLWGVDGAEARPMISLYAQQVLHRAEARNTIKGAVHTVPIVKDETGELNAPVPSKKSDHKLALRKLLTVKEFRAQIEFIPNTVNSNETLEE